MGAVVSALVAGAATALAFPPTQVTALAVVGPAAGLWAFAQARSGAGGALAGLAYGLAFTFAAYHWMLALDLIAYVALSLIQAGFWALTGVVAARTAHLRPGWWVVAVTATWTLAEAVRARFPVSGFEWGQLSLSTADTMLRRAAAIGGALGVTALLIAVAAGAAATLRDRRPRGALPLVASTAALCAVVGLGSVSWTTAGGTLDVAAVQADDPCPGAFAEDCPGYSDVLLDHYVAGTSALEKTPDLIVWGEDALRGGETLDAVGEQFVDQYGPLPAPLLAGTATPAAPGRFYRHAALFDRNGGSLGAYAKRQPVPFGEYVPFRSVLGGISDVGRLVPTDMMPGRDASPVTVPTADGQAMLGTVVSWEVTFSRLVRDVGRQANGLATLTTVASYGTSAASDQLLNAAQLRSAEQQKAMVVGATTGRSALILPTGEVAATSALLQADTLVGSMPLRTGLTPFGRTGDLPLIVAAAATLAVVAWRLRHSGRRASQAVDDTGPDADTTPAPPTDASVAR
jgi:apolipoprotein N-acyltransferase